MSHADRQVERLSTLAEQGTESDLCSGTAEDRWAVMWQLAVDAWAMKGEHVEEEGFRRDVERVIRGRAASP